MIRGRPADDATQTPSIERHKAAIRRTELSRPLKLALARGLIAPGSSVLDYGCGHGDDAKHLAQLGYAVGAWDPHYRPDGAREEADTCYLGFVLNVIENAAERRSVLQEAWKLARAALLVSALVTVDARGSSAGIPFEDGVVTRIGTFQKYYDQQELENFVRQETGEPPIALGMGVFAVVRDPALRASMLLRSVRTSPRRIDEATARELIAQRQVELQPLLSFFDEHGRWPQDEERVPFEPLTAEFGGLGRATRALERAAAPGLSLARAAVTEELLLFSALSQIDQKTPTLPAPLRRDLTAAFGSLAQARTAGLAALRALGDVEHRRGAARGSPVGKRMPEALYVHTSALHLLPPHLRLYEALTRRFVGDVDGANIVKLHLDRPVVSYLSYPTFDQDPHPPLAWSMLVDLQTFRVHINGYSGSNNPPILHRKELFISPDHPLRTSFERLTRQEERWDLYDGSTGAIGNRIQWERRLQVAGLVFRGHRLVRAKV
jgi:DNA phosphorothioation-associated putative methyltransferase